MDDIVFKTPFYGVTALPRPRTTIHDLPNEILAKIFVLCLLKCRKEEDYYRPHRYPPALLTTVCTHWTLVALNTPPLWDTLEYPYNGVTPSPSQVARFFARSRNRNLVLHYDRQAFNRIDVGPQIPWSRITELRLFLDGDMSLRLVRKLLAHTPNLVWLEARRMTGGLDMPAFPPTTLPHLQHLSLDFISCDMLRIPLKRWYIEVFSSAHKRCVQSNPFFLSLVLPKLVYLRIECQGLSWDSQLMQALVDLQLRSGFTLEELLLEGIKFDFHVLYKFFARVPELRRLTLGCGYEETHNFYEVLERLQFRQDRENILLPRLEYILIKDRFSRTDHERLDDISLSALESRWWPKELCPYQQENLGMLKKAVILWRGFQEGEDIGTHLDAYLRAQRLSNKMRLFYPTLGLPYYAGAGADRDPVL